LIESPDQYIGTTVKLGGYILETKNLTDKATIDVLQTPLTGFRKHPKTKEYSEGRFTVSQDGFLDPAEYGKDRMLTVTGTFMGCKDGKRENCMIEGSQIRLWPKVDPRRTETRDSRLKDPFYDPYYFKKGAGGFP
jgi:outer membrane lipoprotein